jgi:hypothetical protein
MASEVDKIWIGVDQLLPEDGRVVETWIKNRDHDIEGIPLKRDGSIWRYRSGSPSTLIPTHWRPA